MQKQEQRTFFVAIGAVWCLACVRFLSSGGDGPRLFGTRSQRVVRHLTVQEEDAKGESPFKDVLSEEDNELLRKELGDKTLLETNPLTVVKCAAEGKYPILMQTMPIIDWVCHDEGERKVTDVMVHVFEKYAREGKQGLMLDIGANAGYYGLLAAKVGHSIVEFDLQPTCLNILRNSVVANGFQSRAWVIPAGISETEGKISVSDSGCEGRFPASAFESGWEGAYTANVPLYPLDHFIDSSKEIMLMKVDTEGNEKRVLAGAMEFFKTKKVRNAIVELTPGHNFWDNMGITKEEVMGTISEVMSHGYVMVSLWDWKILRSGEEAVQYLKTAEWGQADMWFTLEDAVVDDRDSNTFDNTKFSLSSGVDIASQ